MSEIAAFVPLHGAAAIDLREIGNDDDAFEEFAESLLTELGFTARRTGRGPDLGIDIIAEKLIEDAIGGPQTLRYAVECKHYAHSGRLVGLPDLRTPAVIDRVAATSANGFLLLTSTSATASLKSHFEKLSRPGLTVQCWDAAIIARYVAENLPLKAKYFPISLHGTAVSLKRPRGRSQSYCFAQVREHQRKYVGVKYIPSLYVGRQIEERVLHALRSPMDAILGCEAIAKDALITAAAMASKPVHVPSLVSPLRYPHDIFAVHVDAEQIRRAFGSFAHTVRTLSIHFLSAYGLRGATGLRDAVQNLQRALTVAQDELSSQLRALFGIVDAFSDESKRLDGIAVQVGALKTTLKALPRSDRETRRDVHTKLKRLEASLKRPAWREGTGWCPHVSIAASAMSRSGGTRVETLIQLCDDIRRNCLSNVLADVAHRLESLSRAMLVLVDIAGTGKTNLCCRVAFELTPNAFVVFLTAKAQGEVFVSLRRYLQSYITTAFPARVQHNNADNCRWLHARQSPLVVILDGINEASDQERLKRNLAELSELAISAPARVLLTSRAEYWARYQSALPLLRDSEVVEGALGRFTDDEQRLAVQVYLDYYRLKVRLEGSAWEQLKRPLLLRFFCEAYGNPLKRKYHQLPVVSRVSLVRLFDTYVFVKYQISPTLRREREFASISALSGKRSCRSLIVFFGGRCHRWRVRRLVAVFPGSARIGRSFSRRCWTRTLFSNSIETGT
ncbi:MAG TPA: restriction endonuclease [Thermoanaerobaculia bacterium]|nr:restriction endonuclease [Thermoanaerobaculia bacterium]